MKYLAIKGIPINNKIDEIRQIEVLLACNPKPYNLT